MPKFVDIKNARTEEQIKVMEKIIVDGGCPFCLENLTKYHETPIIKEGTYWVITRNRWPYENTRVHLLAILKEHAVSPTEVDPAAGAELFSLLSEMSKTYQISGGGLCMRFGESAFSASTVSHLHAHFIEPDASKPEFKPVRFKLGMEWERREPA